MPLEVCCYSLSSCITAQRAGAHRVELCAGAEVGGTTPLRETIIAALDLGIPVVPMVRPRGGDFLYGTAELEEVRKAVRMCRELGCTAIVSGVQLRDGRLDAGAMKRIVDLAGPLEVACHKVFDGVPDAAEALETLVEAGCVRVLTSGMAADAMAGAHGLHGLLRGDPSADAEKAHYASRDDHAPPLEIGASCRDLILQTPEPALMVVVTRREPLSRALNRANPLALHGAGRVRGLSLRADGALDPV